MGVPNPFKVEDAVSALKNAGIWPEKPTPVANCNDSVIYLEIFPKVSTKKLFKIASLRNPYSLAHPLKLHENVCVILKTLKNENVAIIKSAFAEIGVVGEINITSLKNVNTSIFQESDTILVDDDIHDEVSTSWESEIESIPGRFILTFDVTEDYSNYVNEFRMRLAKTYIISNGKDKLVAKVGNIGMTEDQIKDNCQVLLNKMGIHLRFPGGVDSIKKIGLKIGSSQFMPMSMYDSNDPSVPRKVRSRLNRGRFQVAAKRLRPDVSPKKMGSKRQATGNHGNSEPPKKLKNMTGAGAKPVNGASPKVEVNGSPKKKNQGQVKDVEKTEVNEKIDALSNDLVEILMQQAKQSILSSGQASSKIVKSKKKRDETAESKKKKDKTAEPKKSTDKPKKGKVLKLLPVQKDGELCHEFKQDLMQRLFQFTEGTELEGILIEHEGNQTDKALAEQGTKKDPKTGSPGAGVVKTNNKSQSPKKAKSPKNASPGSSLANGKSPQVKTGKETPKKKKNRKSKTLGKGNPNTASPKVTKAVTPQSLGKKFMKKLQKLSPMQAKVAAI